MSDEVLQDKAVVVTGAGRGIGRAIAEGIAKAGGRVVVADHGGTLRGNDQSPQLAEEVAGEIRRGGGHAVGVSADIAFMTGAQRAIQGALDEWGRLDGVVCCAGILRHGPFADLRTEDFDAVVETHLKGHFNILQTAFKQMSSERTRGSLVAISSGYLSGDPNRASYRAAKAAIVALMKSVALAGSPLGIRCNAIAPVANTRMTEASNLQFDSTPEDIAPLAVYLLSDASGEVNGEVIGIMGNTLQTWRDPVPEHFAHNWRRWEQEDIEAAMPLLLDRGAAAAPPPLG